MRLTNSDLIISQPSHLTKGPLSLDDSPCKTKFNADTTVFITPVTITTAWVPIKSTYHTAPANADSTKAATLIHKEVVGSIVLIALSFIAREAD